MHHRLFVTLDVSSDADSASVRDDAHQQLCEDDSFCGQGGRFGSPLCDSFVIGGCWSGTLALHSIGEAYKAALIERFPVLVEDWRPSSLAESHAAELDALWESHGGTGPSPYTRSDYKQYGYDDDAMLITQALYDAFLAEYAGVDSDRGEYVDLDYEELGPDFVGRKWLVVIDYHN